MNNSDIRIFANTIRVDIIGMISNAGSGHPGGALGMADIFAVLYTTVLNHDPHFPNNPHRDRLYLSNGHICAVLYASLARSGYFSATELSSFRKIDSNLQGHPHKGSMPGIENNSGPLGQGISQAMGCAWELKRSEPNACVFCISGDGELEEGQCWEAALFAAKHKLDNYIHIVDRNHIQIDGTTEEVSSLDPLKKKFEAFGYYVLETDGHDIASIITTLEHAKSLRGKPIVVIAHTTPGKGVSFMERRHEWHGKAPNQEEGEKALAELHQKRGKLI